LGHTLRRQRGNFDILLKGRYVVVSNVLSPVEVEAALDEMWTSKNLLRQFHRHDPGTWSDPSWPQQEGGHNFLASRDLFHEGCNWDIASPPRQYHLHKLLWGRDDLIMSSLDRSGVMRPSEYTIKWKTDTNWLHRYHNPWTKPGFSHVQAIICLTESTPTSGGFACVPGFHERFQKWGDDHPMGSVVVNGKKMNENYGDGQPLPVHVDNPCQQEIIQALAPAGSMILWDLGCRIRMCPTSTIHRSESFSTAIWSWLPHR